MGGGILPIALYKGKILFLFGKEVGERNGQILEEAEKAMKVNLKQQFAKDVKS